MEGVCSTFCDQRNLRSGRPTLIRVGAACRNAELLQRIERGAQSTLKSVAFNLVVVVNPIQRDVGLVAARTAPPRLSRFWSTFVPTNVTPGCKLRICVGSRPSKGSDSICCVPNAFPNVASSLFTCTILPATSTTATSPLTRRVTSDVAGTFTSSCRPSCLMVANPAWRTVRLYVPGGICRNW